MKKNSAITIFATLAVVVSLLSACKGKDQAESAPESAEEKTIQIGISKIIAHPALDAVEQNIIAVVEQSGKSVNFNLQDAAGETSAANSIAQLFQNENVDLAIGIATPTAQALVQNLNGIPIFYSAITDPEGAGLLSKVDSGMKVTGYSDLTPIADHIATILSIQPDLATIGQIYSSDEDNARVLNETTAKIAADNGVKLVSAAVSNTSEVRDAALSIIDKVDALYITVDNKVISALAAVSEVADLSNIPLYTADPSSAPDAKVAVAMGFDYASMGKASGELIVRYLDGDQSVFDTPVNYLAIEYQTFVINQEQVAKLGLTVPDYIVEQAK
ncbi:ABC transporter substrate binding protein [Candidatus Haliotispira prima]|uniref:ABC transporter substrate binding protein n=1 Tax=Candidatus Haliotispira prima TaxID=3034016 RepID=A0ABY8MH04_9SPIO|nr:ABC transporter substrate binding protein [Candidatus Haliotispira prima]